MTAFVLMGVSGVGKTTVGRKVAAQLGISFLEGDDFHPAANVAKMSAGIALDDSDRIPWIEALARAINSHGDRDVIVACSALTLAVRAQLRSEVSRPVRFIHLRGSQEMIGGRMRQREHFMKADLLPSQFAALQLPADAIDIEAKGDVDEVSRAVIVAMTDVGGVNRPIQK